MNNYFPSRHWYTVYCALPFKILSKCPLYKSSLYLYFICYKKHICDLIHCYITLSMHRYTRKEGWEFTLLWFHGTESKPVILFCVHSAPSTMEPQCRAVTPVLNDANNQSFNIPRPLQDFQHLKITWKFCLSLQKCLGQFGLWALKNL